MFAGSHRTPNDLSGPAPMDNPTSLRLLNDPALDGPVNMARDEALLDAVEKGHAPATLRLYEWSSPTISLGYFQPYVEYEKLPPPAGTLPVVRRLTGGGAILHAIQLTYSIVLPARHPLVEGGANRLYELAHEGILASLDQLGLSAAPCGQTDESSARSGPFFCFDRRHRYDLVIGQKKITGSAQRRRRDAVLQHGSIILGNRYAQQTTVQLDLPFDRSMKRARETVASAIAKAMGLTLVTGGWSDRENAACDSLVAKYSGDTWNRRT